MSAALLAAAPSGQHLAHAGHAEAGSVLPGVLVLLLAAVVLLVTSTVRWRSHASRLPNRAPRENPA